MNGSRDPRNTASIWSAARGPLEATVPAGFHVFAALWTAAALLYAAFFARRFPLLTGEDALIEWATVALFAIAGFVSLRRAIRERRPFDLLIALFCIFVAGEEFSWGQRLFGFAPPDLFLEHNGQQELNLHNFAKPRKFFSMAMLGFGLLMPLAWRFRPTRRLMDRIGATAPPAALIPWALAAVLLTQWDPRKVTSEWAEMLAGALFLAWTWRPPVVRRWRGPALAVASAVVLTGITTLRTSHANLIACAVSETSALASDLIDGSAAVTDLRRSRPMDMQVKQAEGHGALRLDQAREFQQVSCAEHAADPSRRRFAVDPWGVAYWIAVRDSGSRRELVLYSLGPNRRIDGRPGSGVGDDVATVVDLSVTRESSAGDVESLGTRE